MWGDMKGGKSVAEFSPGVAEHSPRLALFSPGVAEHPQRLALFAPWVAELFPKVAPLFKGIDLSKLAFNSVSAGIDRAGAVSDSSQSRFCFDVRPGDLCSACPIKISFF
jgi:hypothetical protein